MAGGACVAGKGGVHGRGRGYAGKGVCVAGGMCGRVACMVRACMAGGCAWQGACMAGGACVAGETAAAADGTHPTGMHPCYVFVLGEMG